VPVKKVYFVVESRGEGGHAAFYKKKEAEKWALERNGDVRRPRQFEVMEEFAPGDDPLGRLMRKQYTDSFKPNPPSGTLCMSSFLVSTGDPNDPMTRMMEQLANRLGGPMVVVDNPFYKRVLSAADNFTVKGVQPRIFYVFRAIQDKDAGTTFTEGIMSVFEPGEMGLELAKTEADRLNKKDRNELYVYLVNGIDVQ
jgi:hypothetical protein